MPGELGVGNTVNANTGDVSVTHKQSSRQWYDMG